ncbi:MAG: ParB N-terminal domain-containing protein [Nitrososphaerota archaeon]|nr:ParB N-terminal domain-containing protein [Nitrososphaerota archaeon]MDG6923969.1 ParB N-terminal domain-containing protein [Nitrososphaerota archaeon]
MTEIVPDEILNVPIDKLLISPYQIRYSGYEDPEDLKKLAKSISGMGMQDLPQVRPSLHKEGFFELITGHRRKEAVSKYLGWNLVRCRVYKSLSEDKVLYIAGQDNMTRRNLYPYEKGRYFNLWHVRLDDISIGEIFDLTPQTIYHYRTLADSIDKYGDPLGKDVKQKLVKNVTKPMLELLKKIKAPRDLEEACLMVANGENVERLQEFTRASLNAYSKLNPSGGKSSTNGDGAPILVEDVLDMKTINLSDGGKVIVKHLKPTAGFMTWTVEQDGTQLYTTNMKISA